MSHLSIGEGGKQGGGGSVCDQQMILVLDLRGFFRASAADTLNRKIPSWMQIRCVAGERDVRWIHGSP